MEIFQSSVGAVFNGAPVSVICIRIGEIYVVFGVFGCASGGTSRGGAAVSIICVRGGDMYCVCLTST
jgi:hypothetical protein